MDHKSKSGNKHEERLIETGGFIFACNAKMREEMNRVWKDFFEKNPGMKEEDVWRRVEERLRSVHEGSAQGSSDHGQTNLSNFRNE